MTHDSEKRSTDLASSVRIGDSRSGLARVETFRFPRKLADEMNVRRRAYESQDFDFVRNLYFETMRPAIESVFGWDEARQIESFNSWFRPEEVNVITVYGVDAGWIQQRLDHDAVFLGSIYTAPRMWLCHYASLM